MKKGAVIICSLLLVVFLSTGFVSANWFTDLFGKITGHAISGPTNGLVAYYPFEGNANDESGNGNNGSWIGGGAYTSGKFGQAANFNGDYNGADEYISIPYASSLNYLANDGFAVSAWIKSDNPSCSSSKLQTIFANWPATNHFQFGIYSNGSGACELGTYVNTLGSLNSLNDFDSSYDNQWVLVSAVYSWTGSGYNIVEYRNGQLVGNLNVNKSKFSSVGINNFIIGNNADLGQQREFYGSIDEVRLYNRALSASEVTELYNLGSTPVCVPSWSAWGSCNATCGGGTQTKTDGCGNNQTQTCNTQACVAALVACTNFTYSDWSACNATGTQTRTVLTSLPVNCSGGNPVLIQTCTYTAPVVNATICSANSTCSFVPLVCPEEGKQTKTCAAVNSDCTTSVSSEEVSCTSGKCYGCTYLGKCVEHGFRITESGIARYCNTNDEFSAQKADNSTCQNNYECSSNQCSDSTCVSLVKEIREQKNLLVRIICWLSHPTDSVARDDCVTTFG